MKLDKYKCNIIKSNRVNDIAYKSHSGKNLQIVKSVNTSLGCFNKFCEVDQANISLFSYILL